MYLYTLTSVPPKYTQVLVSLLFIPNENIDLQPHTATAVSNPRHTDVRAPAKTRKSTALTTCLIVPSLRKSPNP